MLTIGYTPQQYVTDGSVLIFNFSFPYQTPTDVKAFLTVADGTVTELSGFNVTANELDAGGSPIPNAGGKVTFGSGTQPAAGTVTLILDPVVSQAVSFGNLSTVDMLAFERAFDKLTIALLAREARLTRALVKPDTDPPSLSMVLPPAAERLGKVLSFDAETGAPIVQVPNSDTYLTVTAYMLTLLADETAADARGTLGLGTAAVLDVATGGSAGLLRADGDGSGLTGVGAITGTVLWFAADDPPSGWLECDGSAVSRTTYADLFAVIGTVFGVGDGSTTFNIPDLRAEFVRGWDNSRGVDPARIFGSGQEDAFESHSHPILGDGTQSYASSASRFGAGIDATGMGVTSAAGGAETRPRNVALLPIIKI